MVDTYLAHHGVKGQHWGVRRYQNADGTRTAEAKQRAKAEKKEAKRQKIVNKTIQSGSAAKVLKNRSKMTDEEFDKAFDRADKIDRLKKIKNGDQPSIGHEVAVTAAKDVTKIAVKAAVAAGAYYYFTKTDSGKAMAAKGKEAAMNAMKSLAKNTAKGTVSVAKSATEATAKAGVAAAKVAGEAVKTGATAAAEKTASAAKVATASVQRAGKADMAKKLQNGNKAAKGLMAYGRMVDSVISKAKK